MKPQPLPTIKNESPAERLDRAFLIALTASKSELLREESRAKRSKEPGKQSKRPA